MSPLLFSFILGTAIADVFVGDAALNEMAEPNRKGFDVRIEQVPVEIPVAQEEDTRSHLAREFPDTGKAILRVDVGRTEGGAVAVGEAQWLADCDWKAGEAYGAVAKGRASRQQYLQFSGPNPADIARTEAYDISAYRIKLAPGAAATVRLYFVEGFECSDRAGIRVFDVLAGGKVVLADVDPFAQGGGLGRTNVAEIRGLVADKDGLIEITFQKKQGGASLSGLEVFEASAGEELAGKFLLPPATRTKLVPAEGAKPMRVLFIGNSGTFFWALPESIAAMINLQQKVVAFYPYRYLHGGWRLTEFFNAKNDPPTGDRVLRLIEKGNFDLVVLQENAYRTRERNQVDRVACWEASLGHIRRVAETCRTAKVKLMLYQTQTPAEANADLDARLGVLAKEFNADLLPTTIACQEAAADPSRPAGYLDKNPDGVHLSVHNAYMVKCLYWIALTGESPVGKIPRTLVGMDLAIEPTIAEWCENFSWKFAQTRSIEKFQLLNCAK